MAYTQLTYRDRILIGVLVQQGKSPTQIAKEMGRHRSSIYRELARNQTHGGYFPDTANLYAVNRKIEATAIPRIDEDLMEWTKEKLLLQWSPEQISNRMKLELGKSISHESIYKMVYADRKEGGTLHLHLRWGRRTRKKRGGGRDKRGQILNRVSIEKRPDVINERGRIGDFEGDLIIGAHHKGMLLTLVDRTSRYTLIEKLNHKTADATAKATVASLEGLKSDKHSITYDNGKEFAAHEQVSKEAGVSIFFAHPYSSYERGTNENTNGLIRQYFPKKYDLRKASKDEVKKVQNTLNHRPREILGFKTPHEFHFGETIQYFTNQ